MTTTLVPNTKALDNLLGQTVETRNTPGLHYAFFDAKSIHHTFSAGKATVQPAVPVDAQTAFYGFSITKTFTATAVLQLAERGELDLDDPVKNYLPEFGYGAGIRIRHLLAHSAGIPNPLPVRWIHRAEDPDIFDEPAFFREIFQKNACPNAKPNERFAYSNLGYIVLGQLIGRVSGLPYRDYIEQHILKPLGVSDQLGFTRQPHWKLATGYQKTLSFGNFLLGFMLDKKQYMGESAEGWKPFLPFYVNGLAYGGLIGKPAAFVAFAQDFLKPEGGLITPASRETMFRENRLNNGRASGMCLAWFCGQLNGHRFLTHAGGGGGYYCEMRVYPELGVGSVLMTNRSGFSDARMLNRFDRLLIG